MLQVARERGLLDLLTNQPIQKCKKCPVASDCSTTVKCCLNRMLSQETEFASEIPALQKTVINRGHKCLFLPKFHYELNPIECAWGNSKKLAEESAINRGAHSRPWFQMAICNFHHQDLSLVSTN